MVSVYLSSRQQEVTKEESEVRWDNTFSVYRGFFLLALIQLCLNRLLK